MKRLIVTFLIVLFFAGCTGNQPTIKSHDTEPVKNVSDTTINNTTSNKTVEKDNKSQHAQDYNKSNKNAITTPVLIKGYLLGGLSKGDWMKYDGFYNSKIVNFDKYNYDVYKNDKRIGTAFGSIPINFKTGETLKKDKYAEEFCLVDLHNDSNENIDYDIAIKACWNLFPRKYKYQSINQKTYDSLVKKLLEDAGIVNPVTSLKQVLRVDLDGDGTEEVLISADNTINYQFEQVKKGDNAIVIFRKLVNGKVIDQVVKADIKYKDDEYESIFRFLYRIETIADLDGDGSMEVILHHWYYEGESWGIYKLENNKLVLITENGSGL